MKIVNVVGARPNFMKIAPLMRQMKKHKKIKPILVHTGQHYDYEMSKIFFKDLGIPDPDIHLGVGSGLHGEQTGQVMIKLEKVLLKEKPDLVLVVGDVNSTMAATLTATKLHIPVAHVESGLRSFDRTMPEEINRLVTDSVADFLFTPSPDGNVNLAKEGVDKKKVFLVGDIMIDSLFYNLKKARKSNILKKLSLKKKGYALLTLHRPSNVDAKENFGNIIDALEKISKKLPIVFPAHPRTVKMIEELGLKKRFTKNKNILLLKPQGYLDFVNLMMNAKFVMTDSGGIQEETTVLDIPCLTLRNTTERPITITRGSNVLVHTNTKKIVDEANKILRGKVKRSKLISYWDGKTAEKIVSILLKSKLGKK